MSNLLDIPWDKDDFNLCLDDFSSCSRLARTKYNKYPVMASPLRKYWRMSTLSYEEPEDYFDEKVEATEEGGHEEQEGNNVVVIPAIPSTPTLPSTPSSPVISINSPAVSDDDQLLKRKKKTRNLNLTCNTDFPYSNTLPIENKVEYISPFSNISFLADDIVFSRSHSIRSNVSAESWRVSSKQYRPAVNHEHSFQRSMSSASNSIYQSPSVYSGSNILEEKTRYSHYFNPTYNMTASNASMSTLSSAKRSAFRKLKSVGLLTKLLKGFKKHLAHPPDNTAI